MRPQWAAAVAVAARLASAGSSGFNVHEDLLAYPQFQVVLDGSYILQAEAQSKLDFASSQSSARPAHQTTSSDHAVSVVKSAEGKTGSQSTGDGSDIPQTYEYMILDSLPYLCSIPQVSEPEQNDTAPISSDEEEEELQRARTRGSQLIGHMDNACLYYVSGWWSYSFCYNSEVKQFHALPPNQNGAPPWPPVEDEDVPSFMLGQYNGPRSIDSGRRAPRSKPSPGAGDKDDEKATDLVEVQSSGSLRYLVQKLGDGTVCDLTNRPRKIEVQYHCAPGSIDKISSVKEISTCSYRMIIYSPKLCDDVAFQPPQEAPQHQIVCREVVAEENLPSWKARKEAEEARRIAESVAEHLAAADRDSGDGEESKAKPTKKLVIGGIEVGGQKTVGSPGNRIEPPKHFVAPRPKLGPVELVWYDPKKNDGKYWMLSDEELKAMEFREKDRKEIKGMADEVYEHDPNKRWKIVVTEREDGVRILSPIFEEEIDLDESEDEKEQTGTKGKAPKKEQQGKIPKKEKQEKKAKKTGTSKEQEAEDGSQEEFYEKDEL